MWLTIRIAVGHELHRPPASVLFLGTPAALHEFGNLPHVVARVPRKGFHSRLVGELRSLCDVPGTRYKSDHDMNRWHTQ